MVFDAPNLKRNNFKGRLEVIEKELAKNKSQYVELLDHYPCKDGDHLQKEL